jgi:PilZ domain
MFVSPRALFQPTGHREVGLPRTTTLLFLWRLPSRRTIAPVIHSLEKSDRYFMNRRRQIRYPLRNPVLYLWEREGVALRGHGWTQTVSEQGIYISSRNSPREGDSINLVLEFSSQSSQVPPYAVRMEMEGNVVRIDRDEVRGEIIGFAVARRENAASLKEFSSRAPREISSTVPRYLARIN